MNLFDRLRGAVAGFLQQPTTTLVRVGRPEPLPGPPRARRELPALQNRSTRGCGCGSQGISAFGRVIAPGMGATSRPQPIGRGPAHDKALYRDGVSAWRDGSLSPPPPDAYLAELRAELHAPRIPWWEQRDS